TNQKLSASTVTRWVISQESAEHPEVRKEEGNKVIDKDKELEEVKLENDRLDGKLAGLLKASKNLDHLIESQRSDQVKEGVGYNVVPPPAADLYLSPKKDLSWTGLPQFVDNIVTDYGRPSPTVASTSAEGQIKDSSTSEDVASPNPSKPFVKFVKPKDSQSESKTKEHETLKKLQVKYAEQYRHSNKKPKGNQRNWNNLKSYQLGSDFFLHKKPCFNCGAFSHLANDCRRRVKKRQLGLKSLSQVEARLVEFKNQEIKFCEKIRGLEFKVEAKANKIENLTNELETLKKENEGLDSKLTGLSEFADDTVTDNSRPSPAIESNSDDLQNRNPSVTETGASSSTILSKLQLRRLWAKNNNTHKSRTPRTVFHKTGRPQMRTNILNMNVAQPKRTYFYKPAHSYVNRPFQRKPAVRTQVRVPTVNRKFPTVNRKFSTGNSKFSTADMDNKGTAIMSLLIEDMCHLVKEDARLLAKEQSKPDEKGIVIRNKARLMAQGYTQEEGINYDEVFSPVARIEAIRLFLAYASFMGFTVYQMDAKSAFLYAPIDEEVYVMQPFGF
nr:copia protein [Tanacetum cinerariifolium]